MDPHLPKSRTSPLKLSEGRSPSRCMGPGDLKAFDSTSLKPLKEPKQPCPELLEVPKDLTFITSLYLQGALLPQIRLHKLRRFRDLPRGT